MATIVLAALAVMPGVAQARAPVAHPAQTVCECMVKFANRYVHRASYRNRIGHLMARRGVNARRRRSTKRGIYDWEKDHRNLPNWCRRSSYGLKACRAAITCIGAAAVTIRNEGTSGKAFGDAAVACAGAAAVVWLSP